MKTQKSKENDKKQQPKAARGYHGKMAWKITAIALIAAFALLIAGGLIKAHYIRSSFIKPTQSQIDYAAKIATGKLQSMAVNASEFQIQVGSRMRKLRDDGAPRTIIQVSFYNKATTHTYLIDVNSGEILLHSETDIYKAFGEYRKEHYLDERKHFGKIDDMMYAKK